MKVSRAALGLVMVAAALGGCPRGSNTPGEGSSSSGSMSTSMDGGTGGVGSSTSASGASGATGSAGSGSSAVGSGSSTTQATSSNASSSVTASSGGSGATSMAALSSGSSAVSSGSGVATSGSGAVSSGSGGGATSAAAGSSSGGDGGVPRVPCAPEACPTGSTCVGPTDDQAYCYLSCARGMDGDCASNEICTGLSGVDAGYCRAAAGPGQSCETLPCLTGNRCVRYSGLPPTCYPACQPGGAACPGMDRCLGLVGQDAGFCAPPNAPDGGAAGDPCAPEACRAGLVCVGPTDDQAFCFVGCAPGAPGACTAQELCAPLPGVDAGYCSPAAGLGMACNPPACALGLLCVSVEPTAPLCYEACDLDAGTCAQPSATCRPLQGVTVGYCSP